MNIDKYKQADGTYYDAENDLYFEGAEAFLHSKVLGFCGCGQPHKALLHVKIALEQVAKLRNVKFNDSDTGEISYEQWDKETNSLLGGETGAYFMFYFLDREEFTDHGSGVPGWLTPEGEELLQDLNEFFAEDNKN